MWSMKTEKIEKTMKHNKNNIAFIDAQNMYLAVQESNWLVDYKKFRVWLRDKYNIGEAYYFLGYLNEDHQDLYTALQKAGFIVEFKEHTSLHASTKKGNVDALMVFKIMHKMLKESSNFDKIVIVSSDGDFYQVVKFLIKEGRFEKILHPTKKNASSLYEGLGSEYYDVLENPAIQSKIAYTKKRKGS